MRQAVLLHTVVRSSLALLITLSTKDKKKHHVDRSTEEQVLPRDRNRGQFEPYGQYYDRRGLDGCSQFDSRREGVDRGQ